MRVGGEGVETRVVDGVLQIRSASRMLGYLNADHWAVAVPINRTHSFIGATFVDKNAFPREVLVEAIIRFVEEDLNRR